MVVVSRAMPLSPCTTAFLLGDRLKSEAAVVDGKFPETSETCTQCMPSPVILPIHDRGPVYFLLLPAAAATGEFFLTATCPRPWDDERGELRVDLPAALSFPLEVVILPL